MKEIRMKKGNFIRVLFILIILLWIGYSIFAYTRHNVTEQVVSIGEYIEFENYGVLIKSVEIYDYERNYVFHEFDYSWVPEPLIYPFLRIVYFYSDPYVPMEYLPECKINCEVLQKDGYYFDDEQDDLRIGLYDEVPYEWYPMGVEVSWSSDTNVIQMNPHGTWQDKSYKGVFVECPEVEELIKISMTGKFEEVKYSFLRRKERSTYFTAERCFGALYYSFKHDIKEAAAEYIFDESDFDWEVMEQIDIGDMTRSVLTYVGDWNGLEDVFELTYFEEDNLIETRAPIYMVYDKDQWYVAGLGGS